MLHRIASSDADGDGAQTIVYRAFERKILELSLPYIADSPVVSLLVMLSSTGIYASTSCFGTWPCSKKTTVFRALTHVFLVFIISKKLVRFTPLKSQKSAAPFLFDHYGSSLLHMYSPASSRNTNNRPPCLSPTIGMDHASSTTAPPKAQSGILQSDKRSLAC